MGDINNRNLQLKLAFQDEDMRKPTHDKIMRWLDVWIKDTKNVTPFLKRSVSRSEINSLEFDEHSLANLERSKMKDSILRQLKPILENAAKGREAAWEDEPPRTIKFVSREWEPMLHTDSSYSGSRMLGFCDLRAVYEITTSIYRKVVTFKRLPTIEPDANLSTSGFKKWVIEDSPTATRHSYETGTSNCSLHFEVKSEIRSIGELMRQLSLYSSSQELKYGERLIVVAPPNNEAAEVVRSHGYGFVEYRTG